MQRWTTTVLGITVVVLAAWIVALNLRGPRASGHEPSSGATAIADGGGLLFAYGEAGTQGAGGAPGDAGGAFLVSDLLDRDPRYDDLEGGVPGTLMPDGTPAPRLPMSVPRQVRFGVALVAYAGAQQMVGARPATRSRGDARALADRILSAAQQDFHAAVQQGDIGSTDDAGLIKPGILEPAPEYVLFTLPVGGIGGPVDTPRGYWIVKRLE